MEHVGICLAFCDRYSDFHAAEKWTENLYEKFQISTGRENSRSVWICDTGMEHVDGHCIYGTADCFRWKSDIGSDCFWHGRGVFWQMYSAVNRVKRVEQELARQQMVWLREQKAMKDGYVKDAKRMHDMKHVLLYLQKCIAEKDTEKAEEYLKTYTEDVIKSQKKIWTGFSEIDFSVNYYYQMMQEKGISFSIETDVHDIPMEELDLMIIFGNLLDNAMTAAEKCNQGEKRVYLKLQTINEMFFLKVENSMNQMPEKKNGRFLSSKAESEYHGWGIENVKRIVEKYNGDIQFEYTEKNFKVEIMIYGKADGE